MKLNLNRLLTLGLSGTIILFAACKKSAKSTDEISPETISRIEALGFGTIGIQKVPQGYLVEGDIILTDENLRESPGTPSMIIAQEEQYHTFNLVTGLPRTITVSVASNLPASISTAVDVAIARYDAEGLQINLNRHTFSTGGNIHIAAAPSGAGYIASAGFPTSSGNPYNSILFNTQYATWNASTLASVLAHEIGHCIGFRHTDYMRRRYSCGYGGNEGQASNGVGAVHIPGTPTGPDPNSWMLACIGNGTDRPFNANDKTALAYVY
jgi:hypothetical protein